MNLTNLISNLRRVDISNYNKLFRYGVLLKNYRTEEWIEYLDKSKIYKYQKNLIHQDKQFEMYLINWPQQYQSTIHNHSVNGCLMKVLQGQLEEKIYTDQLDFIESNLKYKGDVSYIDDTIGYHSISNNDTINTISLHIYSPPLHKTDYF